MKWYLYIVKCNDGSLYTGITNDIKRRVEEHNNNNLRGSKYIRYKRPVVLVYNEEFKTRPDAAKREIAIKGWTRKYKLELIEKFNLKNSL